MASVPCVAPSCPPTCTTPASLAYKVAPAPAPAHAAQPAQHRQRTDTTNAGAHTHTHTHARQHERRFVGTPRLASLGLAARPRRPRLGLASTEALDPLRLLLEHLGLLLTARGCACVCACVCVCVCSSWSSAQQHTHKRNTMAQTLIANPNVRLHGCARVVMFLGWVFIFISAGSPHVRPVGRTWGGPKEIELTPIGVKLYGPRRVHGGGNVQDGEPRVDTCREGLATG